GLALAMGLGGAAVQQPPAGAKAEASVNAVAFMAGQWKHEDAEGVTEEHWSAPSGNNVMGMFRWLKPDGTPTMFEILAVTGEADGVYLRLKHFNARLQGKEEKDDTMTLKLAEARPTKAVFKGVEGEKRLSTVTYERTGDVLKIKVEFP